MELIYIKENWQGHVLDSGILQHYEADFEIGEENNNFEITMATPTRDELLYIENHIKTRVFADETEFGGYITGIKISAEASTVTYTGKTWRGMQQNVIVEPPRGEDYKILSGNVGTAMRQLPFPSIYKLKPCDLTANQFQVERYVTLFDTVKKYLATATPHDVVMRINYSLQYGGAGVLTAEFLEKINLSNQIEFSQDYNDNIDLTIIRDGDTPKRLICLGQGDLKDREVINLYADDNWNVSKTPNEGYPCQTYDFGSSEDLLKDSMKHYQELISQHTQIEVSIDGVNVNLGDIVSARDQITGEYVSAEISSIIWKRSDFGDYATESYEYKTKVRV